MKLAILTSNHLRHQFFTNSLISRFEVVALLQEDKARDPSKKGEGTELEPLVKNYFDERTESEQSFFSADTEIRGLDESQIHIVEPGTLNSSHILHILLDAKPDYIAVFGSSIIGEEIIEAFPNKIINMHLGLSPYYRGSGTNFWPLYDEKPEYVGVTIHYLDKGTDTGKMIIQGRPDIVSGDTTHSIGNKTIVAGTQLMASVMKHFEEGGGIKGVEQNHSVGKLCLFKDCTPQHIESLMQKCNDGLIENYVARVQEGTIDDMVLADETCW